VCHCVCAELGVVVPKRIQSHISNNEVAKLHAIARLPRCGHDFMAVYGKEFVLIMLDGNDLLHCCRIAAKHDEVFPFEAHEEVHAFEAALSQELCRKLSERGVAIYSE